MKKLVIVALFLLAATGLAAVLYLTPAATARISEFLFGDEPDMPDFARYKIDKEDFMLRRAEAIAMRRGIKEGEPFDPKQRIDAIRQMEAQEAELLREDSPQAAWTEIGPNPIPNAQVGTGPSTTASGRTIAIAVHPTNPDIVYVGTAQGGLYRSTNGGTNWTRMMDGALSLAIGAVAIAPSQPDTVFVGTGEPNFSADSFFGVGIYRIDNASTATPTVSGPFNISGQTGLDIFTGRAISEILVHPTNPDIIFASTTSGIGGLRPASNNTLPARGIYRSLDATSVAPVFEKLTGLDSNANKNVRDMVLDPDNPNLLVANVLLASATSGIYVSNDALSIIPSFTQRVSFSSTSTSELTAEFAINTVSDPPTIYAATGNLGGRVLRSTDGGVTWTQQIDNNFCTPQCFYDICIDVDPTNANNVYLGGAPAVVFARSTDSGVTFTTNAITAQGLHVDSHAIAVAPSQPTTIYFGSDGGIYKTLNSGTNWTSLNNSQFTATQFMGLAVHSIDPNFTIGGTQDNGTNFYRPDGTWIRADFGDGGYALIDQTDISTTVVDMYHTYFNAATLMGYAYVPNTATAMDNGWVFRGCQVGGATVNGITCSGTVNFYAPLEQGPPVLGSLGNTIYYGTQVLYRSTDTGLNHAVVSQTMTFNISAIGIAPSDDNVRAVGLNNGAIFGTSTGATTLVDLDPSNVVPNVAINRVVIDPNNADTAYVTLSRFGTAGTENVWKTTNLSSLVDNLVPAWASASGSGANALPPVPVNGLIVDPTDSNRLYAGTDIGVYTSANGGASWTPFGTGLPRVAVFDIAIAPGTPRMVRIATHGRGLWQTPVFAPTAATVSVSGRVLSSEGSGIPRARVTVTDENGNVRTAITNGFGYYRFDEIAVGETYVFSVSAKRYTFEPRVLTINEEMTNLDFLALK